MVNLSININKVALLRNQRSRGVPDLVSSALSLVSYGVDGLTVHPRPDERHIRYSDIDDLSGLWLSGDIASSCEFNIEGYPSSDWLSMVHRVRPHQATLVPDLPDALTSDSGWDVISHYDFLRGVVGDLRSAGIRVSIFLGTDIEQVRCAGSVGVDCVEFYTGPYADCFERGCVGDVMGGYVSAGIVAGDLGLGINAGHDLDLFNLSYFVGSVVGLREVSIGHAFISDSLRLGFEGAVVAYRAELEKNNKS